MNLTKEIAAMAAVGIVAFGWTFGQSPMSDQSRSAKADIAHSFGQHESQPGDQVAIVLHTGSTQKAVPLSSVELQMPVTDQQVSDSDLQIPVSAPQTQDNLLQVTATSLKMRTGPSSQTQMINVYDRGTTFEKIDQQGQWLQVRSTQDGASGWMFAEFLQTTN